MNRGAPSQMLFSTNSNQNLKPVESLNEAILAVRAGWFSYQEWWSPLALQCAACCCNESDLRLVTERKSNAPRQL